MCVGMIPEELGLQKDLEEVNLSSNQLTGKASKRSLFDICSKYFKRTMVLH